MPMLPHPTPPQTPSPRQRVGTTQRLAAMALLGASALVLGGCENSQQDDLGQWMNDLRTTTKPRIIPLTEPKPYFPQEYNGDSGMQPFDPMKLTQALRRESTQGESNASLIAPEMARRKEPLESYPLDAIQMVGSIEKATAPSALITVDKQLYQVKLGNYLGQNYGKIVAISETAIELREIIQDSSGDWIERMTTLDLQEGKR